MYVLCMCFTGTGLEKELPNGSYVLKHALAHKRRALQNGSCEDQPSKSSSEFTISSHAATFVHFTTQEEHPNQFQQQAVLIAAHSGGRDRQ